MKYTTPALAERRLLEIADTFNVFDGDEAQARLIDEWRNVVRHNPVDSAFTEEAWRRRDETAAQAQSIGDSVRRQWRQALHREVIQ